MLHIVTRYTSNAVRKALLVKHICKLFCFRAVLAMIFHACMSVKNCAAKNKAVHAADKCACTFQLLEVECIKCKHKSVNALPKLIN